MHFEELWVKCEDLFKSTNDSTSVSSIMDELSMKINLYKLIDSKVDITPEERQKVKSRTMGEILLTLTQLSLKENIDVFECLSIAQQYRSSEVQLKG
jgi:hypothetical protein